MDSLLALRSSVAQPGGFTLVVAGGAEAEIDKAEMLRVGEGREFPLADRTAFDSADGPVDLRTVVNCWLCRELGVAEYIQRSAELGIPHLKFIERTDLVEWLEGSGESEYIKTGDVEMADADTGASTDLAGGVLPVPAVERDSVLNQTTVLHGVKVMDFSKAALLSHKTLVGEYRSLSQGHPARSSGSSRYPAGHSGQGNSSSGGKLPPLKPHKGRDPIILLSPSPSSLLNMANVQDFLERGVFKPVLKSSSSANLLRIVRDSKIIGSRVRFVVVDTNDHFKPEYWDRVVAVFVTGQAWQFRGYRWPDPNKLFQNVLGFGLVYKNDPVPQPMRQWNVQIEPLERNVRFRDREVVERIWERIEAHMISRGWPVNVA